MLQSQWRRAVACGNPAAQQDAQWISRQKGLRMSEPTITGTVKWFNATKGYGFLATASHGDLFVHVSALVDGRTALYPGERVSCGVQQGRKGPQAGDVHVAEPVPQPTGAAPGAHAAGTTRVVAEIATQLGETTTGAQQKIRHIVQRLGADVAMAFRAP